MRWLNVVASVDTIYESNNNVTVKFSNVTKLESKWKIEGMNLIIKNSFLPKTHFHLNNYNVQMSYSATIITSTFGQLTVENGYRVQISNCILKGGPWKSSALINITNSTMNITTTKFLNFKAYAGPGVLDVASSIINVKNSQFQANIGKHGVIEVGQKSHLTVHNTLFENNGFWYFAQSTILVKSESVAVLLNSNFTKNIASIGGCIASFSGTYLEVQNTTFFINQGSFGGSIYCVGTLYGSEKLEKSSLSKQTDLNLGKVTQSSQCSIKKSIFLGNFALQRGGSAYFNGSTVQILDCHFQISAAYYSGGAIMAYNSNITISSSTFNTTGTKNIGGAMSAEDSCIISIKNTIFTSNTGLVSSGFQIQNRVILTMKNATVKIGDSGYLFDEESKFFSVSDHCLVTVMNSNFETNNHCAWVFDIEVNSNLTVMGSTFNPLRKSATQIVTATQSSRVSFTKCTFQQCAGFVVSDNCYLHMKESILTKSQYVVSDALISASLNSKIDLDETNITDIIPNVDLPFVRSDSSNVSIRKCLYSGNRLSRHIVATGNSLIAVSESNFNNNTFNFGIMYSSIFHLMASHLSLDGITFDNNHQYMNYGLYNVAIVDAYSSDVEINSCTFTTSVYSPPLAPTFILHMRLASLTDNSQNYLQINNSIFNSKSGCLRVDNVADVNIQSSFFQVNRHTDFPVLVESGLQLAGLKSLRIADSHFNSSKDAKTQIALRYQASDFQFLTSYSNFTFGNISLQSNGEHFLNEAQNFGLIEVPEEVRDKHEETAYASSKYFVFQFLTRLKQLHAKP